MVKALLVGEAWGAEELVVKHPFVGTTGRELSDQIAQIGLAPYAKPSNPRDFHPSPSDMVNHWALVRQVHDIGLSNVFNLRPENNDVELFFGNKTQGRIDYPPLKKGKWVLPEYLPQVERLYDEILSLKPNLIVALGNTPSWAVLGRTKIRDLRGAIHISPRLGIKVLPTYHPSAVVRQWPLRTIVLRDLLKAKKHMEFKDFPRTERWFMVYPSFSEIEEWFMTKPIESLSIDIETYMGQISTVGFARSPHDAISIPIMDLGVVEILRSKKRKKAELKPGMNLNYWPTEADEARAWKWIAWGLSHPAPKVFQNAVYDISYFLRMGLVVRNVRDDTMLRQHSLYPEMLKSLGFLGSVFCDEIAWKLMAPHNQLKRDE